jgi:4-hydroxybenzoate polyprenyltransferase
MQLSTRARSFAAYERPTTGQLPLCVDLDGTLINTDTLPECAIRALGRPRAIFARPFPFGSRAAIKDRLTAVVDLDVRTLPYNEPLLAWLREEHSRGRELVLVTATHTRLATRVAQHLKIFESVLATAEKTNLRGRAKAEALVSKYGVGGFSYVGNDKSDLHVWETAGAAVVVNAGVRLTDRVKSVTRIERRFERSGASVGRAVLRAMRVHQWSKNTLLFIPIVTARSLDAGQWMAAVTAFFAFSLTASAIYLVNDLSDLDADRLHPRKRYRPLASGVLPLAAGVFLVPLLLAGGFSLASAVGGMSLVVTYALLSLAYSFRLKRYPLVDLFTLAGLYTIRLFAGGVVTGHKVSAWLLAFSVFFFLGLAFVKRVGELRSAGTTESDAGNRRGYQREDLAILTVFGAASAFAATLVLALYVQAELQLHPDRGITLWAIVPLLLFWQCRLWLATERGYMEDDPIVYATKDWVSHIVVACLIGIFALDAGLSALG